MSGYGSDSGFDDWLTAQGYALPDGSPSNAVLRERGSVYLDGAYGDRFPGQPVSGVSQDRAWPRSGATDRWGNSISSASIPARIIEASYYAAYQEAVSAGSLSASLAENEKVKRLKAGSVEIEYGESGSIDTMSGAVPRFTVIEGLIDPLLVASNIPGVLVV